MSVSADAGTAGDAENDGAAVPPDQGFELLSNRRRRYALRHLSRTESGEADIGELSERVAAWENDVPLEEVSATERKRVYTSLQQLHLPRMDEMDVVEFDGRSGAVELGPAAEDLTVYLEVVTGRDVPWSQFYLGLAAINATLVVLAGLAVSPFDGIPDLGWAAFAVTSFLLSAAFHTYYAKTEMALGATDEPPELDA